MLRTIKSFKISLLVILLCNNVYSQNEEFKYNLIERLPSPNSAALAKYSNIPVNLSTGIPSISIPITEVDKGGLNLPLILNYYSGGVRVQEESSWVGLGWSLPLGGIISRAVRGRPDDEPGGFLQNCSKMINEDVVGLNLDLMATSEFTYKELERISNNLEDYEPDLFSYCIGKASGNFMFNNHEKITLTPFADIIIEPIFYRSKISGFNVIDANGIIYIYGDTTQYSDGTNEYIEFTTNVDEGISTGKYNAGWVINQIINPFTGQRIVFHYTNAIKRTVLSGKSDILYESIIIGPALYKWEEMETFNRTNVINYNYCCLNKIVIDNDSITFHSSSTQEEIRKLDSINFKDMVVKFYYYENERTYLDSIVMSSILNCDNKQKYQFEYVNIDNSTYNVLPSKNSYKIDYWGYFNNRINTSESSIPKINYLGEYFGDADRSPDERFSKAGLLSKITYPTGGTVDLLYQNNTYARYLTIEEVSHKEIAASADAYGDEGMWWNDTIVDINFVNHPNIYNIHIFTSMSIGDFPPHHIGNAQIIDEYGSIIWQKSFNEEDLILQYDEIIELDPSKFYRLKVSAKYVETEMYAHIEYSWYDSQDLLKKKDELAGGVRISQIIKKDSPEGKQDITSYEYNLSGYLTAFAPKYYTLASIKRMNVDGLDPFVEDVKLLHVYARPVGGLNNSISYSKVIEYYGTPDNNNGKEITYFDEIQDEPTGVAYSPDENNQYLRNIPIKKEYFDINNNLLKVSNYEYEVDYNHTAIITAFRAIRIRTIDTTIPMTIIDFPFCHEYGNYEIRSFIKRMKKETDKIFYNNGTNYESKTYYYANDNLNPTKIILNKSNDSEEIIEFKYPSDYIPELASCDYEYNQAIEFCNSINGQQCVSNYNECKSLFNSCHDVYVEKKNNDFLEFSKFVMTLGFSTIPDMIAMEKRIEDVTACYSMPDGYYDCINNLDCGNIACIDSLEQEFNLCVINNYNNIISSYNSSTDPSLRANILMYLIHNKNAIINKKIIRSGILAEEYNISLKEQEVNDTYLLPILKKVTNNLCDENLNTVISYDIIDNNSNIIQSTKSGQASETSVWGYNNKYLLAQAYNSKENECGYTGFENDELNGWSENPDNSFENEIVFTGKNSILVNTPHGPGREFKVGMNARNHNGYQASVWVKGCKNAYLHIEANNFNFKSHISNEEGTDDWHLLRVQLFRNSFESLIDTNLIIRVYIGNTGGGNAYFDDLRFHPMDAKMTTYTYEPLLGVTSVSDMNNKPIRYEYDGLNRLILTRDFHGNILKKYDYHYRPQ